MVRRIDGEHVTGERRPGKSLGHDSCVADHRGVHVLRQPRVVEGGASFVVVDDEPRFMAIDERHPMDRATPPNVGEQRKWVVAVECSPRLQRRSHVLLDHREHSHTIRNPAVGS